MRFISPYSQYRFIAKHAKTDVDTNGRVIDTVPGYTVQFRLHDLTDFERELARTSLQLKSKGVRRDGTAVDPVNWVSSFDTMEIEDPKLRKEVEERMLRNPDFGNPSMGYILVEKPAAPAPWPNYDELTVVGARNSAKVAETNLQVAAATGVSLHSLIAYERENRKDQKIIAAYEAALAEQAQEEAEELVTA